MRSSQKVATVSVGIPAYNEERNIAPLLRAILAQRCEGFELLEVVVLSDGSTDRTVEEVRSVADPRVRLIHEPYRIGQSARQSQLLRLCTGDVSVLLEADTFPKGDSFLARLVAPVLRGEVDLAQGLQVPAEPNGWLEHVLFSQYHCYLKFVPLDIDHLVSGRGGRAFSKKLRQSFHWPTQVPEDLFALRWAKLNGLPAALVPEAENLFRLPSSVGDFLKQRLKIAAAASSYTKHVCPGAEDGIGRLEKSVRRKFSSFAHFLATEPLKAVAYLLLHGTAAAFSFLLRPTFHFGVPVSPTTKSVVT